MVTGIGLLFRTFTKLHSYKNDFLSRSGIWNTLVAGHLRHAAREIFGQNL
jgi:hypothetical protein